MFLNRTARPTRLRALASHLWTRCNESMLGIRTEPNDRFGPVLNPAEPWEGEPCDAARNHDNFRYGTIGYSRLRRLLSFLQPGPDDVFFDIGSGMGRVLCLAAQTRVRKCVGIELLEPLCEIARQNAARLRRRKAPIQIVCQDATRADFSEGTIYFMFNPFGPDSLRETMESIRATVTHRPRSLKIVYYHSKYQSVLEPLDWLVKVREFKSFGGHPVSIWENRPPWDLAA